MRRSILACAALAVLGVPCRADETAVNPETLIRLTVQPAAAAKPALRYQLLPELTEMNPGNPIQNYSKCFMDEQRFFFDKEAVERREKLLAMTFEELPARELRQYGGFALSQAVRAARLDNPDWQVLLDMKAEGIYAQIPDVRQLRPLAKALKVRMRAEVALSHFDDALRTAKTIFAMSRHLGEHPTFVGNLYGFVIANLAIGPLEEMLEQPGCPNLYWALTNLPNPLISLATASQGERVAIIQRVFRDLDVSAPMSADRLTRLVASMDKLIERNVTKELDRSSRAWLDGRTKDEGMVAAARHRLVEGGLSEALVRLFPADQVILLDEKRKLELRFDDHIKLTSLPMWQALALASQTMSTKEPALFANDFIPEVFNMLRVKGRLEQRLALLRHVEAVRLYAAEHNGALPPKLSDITVPLPDDPVTGKPFRYEVNGTTAHLRGTPPPGMEKDPASNVHYEVTLQK